MPCPTRESGVGMSLEAGVPEEVLGLHDKDMCKFNQKF